MPMYGDNGVEFFVGDFVVCIKSPPDRSLTEYKSYQVVSEDDGDPVVLDDTGNLEMFFAFRFNRYEPD